ncbi:FAD-dependent monooxygenase, partial [Streptomyces sp. 8L]|uniref:FAD-dependent monooxygenase n=1 Tax=Streptomyces sp. 8L TaxID=2877242 RepID=UPI001CD76017
MTTDVTVVGAGPVGLVLAAELALSGARVQVLERLTEPDEGMKAGAINVPTAEALDRRGLLPAAERVQREMLARVGPIAPTADRREPGNERRDGRGSDDQGPGGGRGPRPPRARRPPPPTPPGPPHPPP